MNSNKTQKLKEQTDILTDMIIQKLEGQQIEFKQKVFTETYRMILDIQTKSDCLFAIDNYNNDISKYISFQCVNQNTFKGEQYIDKVIRDWENFKFYLNIMHHVYKPLENYYLKKNSQKKLNCMGLELYEQYFLKIQDKLFIEIEQFLVRSRNDQIVSKEKFKIIINYFVIFGYGNSVQIQLDQFKQLQYDGILNYRFYNQHLQKFLITEVSQKSVPEYVMAIKKILRDEEERAKMFFNSSMENYIQAIEIQTLILPMDTILKNHTSGLQFQLHSQQIENLKELFQLFSRQPQTIQVMATIFGKHIQDSLKTIFNDNITNRKPLEFIQQIIDFKNQSDKNIKIVFNNNIIYQQIKNEKFIEIIKTNQNIPNFLAIYSDFYLKQGMRGQDSEQVNDKISSIIQLFKYISEKDSFMLRFEKLLGLRLLNQTSLSIEYELSTITELKREIGATMLIQCQQMISDMNQWNQTNQEYQKSPIYNKQNPIETYFQILMKSSWDDQIFKNSLDDSKNIGIYYKCISELPLKIQEIGQNFCHYYDSKYKNRVLYWLKTLGQSEIYLVNGQKKYTLVVNNSQLAILLLFNKNQSLSVKEIQEYTNISIEELQINLDKLYIDRILALNHQIADLQISRSEPQKFLENDVFSNNLQYENKQIKIPLFNLRKKQTSVLSQKENNDLQIQRDFQTDSKIVKVMKSRKQADLNSIIVEINRLSSQDYQPDVKHVKQRIESLISREFIKRDQENPNNFIYLA